MATSPPPEPERTTPVVPTATYRLQFRNGVDFGHAAALVPYLARLGVSHLYSSPYLAAAAGSSHGYDVVDPAAVEPALGGEAALGKLRGALAAEGIGEILDVVPNHTAIPGRENPWWWDVLENGPSSPFARFFDVDWDPPESYLRNRVLIPILGDQYGVELESGELQLERAGASFELRYYEHRLPIAPRSLDALLAEAASRLTDGAAARELAFLAESFGRLPPSSAADRRLSWRRHRDKQVLGRLLAELLARPSVDGERPSGEEVARAIDAVVADINADPDRLDALIGRQNYRIAWWRAARRELGYRRFFDVTTLVGMRQEDPDVFDATHPLIRRWLESGELDGIRVDHPDGLRDPKRYLERLRGLAPRAWIVAEKILEPGERLREDWPIAGTTGYDFMFFLDNLFVDRRNEAAFTRAYADFSGETREFEAVALEAKRLILRDVLASELARLVALLLEICERHRRYRDYTRHDLNEALLEIAACFPVYRTYVRAAIPETGEPGEVSAADRRAIDRAIELAARERPAIDAALLDFVRSVLTLERAGDLEGEFAMRFQQLTGAAMAKGIEDTAFYRYFRLTSLNEVGGDPGTFGLAPEVFHRHCEEQQSVWPAAMVATSTHDTKRSEDVRARISLLSEIPERWAATVARWSEIAAPHRTGNLPDRNTEWLYYQTLVGAWPLAPERAEAYMEKAIREAKSATSWAAPDEAYETAVRRFVDGTLADEAFCAAVESFVASLHGPWQTSALAAALLKLTAPGVPDVYQGTELWDLSLVDPDNRRPVDFALRERLLGELDATATRHGPAAAAADALRRADEGLPKLWLTRTALGVRAANREAFGPGSRGAYQPLAASGERAEHVVGFLRGRSVAVVVPRLALTLGGDWADTAITLPEGRWRDELTGRVRPGGETRLRDLLEAFPVGLLVRQPDAAEPA